MDGAQAMAETAMRGAAEFMRRQHVEYTDELGARICDRMRSLLHGAHGTPSWPRAATALGATNADIAATTVALSLFQPGGIEAARAGGPGVTGAPSIEIEPQSIEDAILALSSVDQDHASRQNGMGLQRPRHRIREQPGDADPRRSNALAEAARRRISDAPDLPEAV